MLKCPTVSWCAVCNTVISTMWFQSTFVPIHSTRIQKNRSSSHMPMLFFRVLKRTGKHLWEHLGALLRSPCFRISIAYHVWCVSATVWIQDTEKEWNHSTPSVIDLSLRVWLIIRPAAAYSLLFHQIIISNDNMPSLFFQPPCFEEGWLVWADVSPHLLLAGVKQIATSPNGNKIEYIEAELSIETNPQALYR